MDKVNGEGKRTTTRKRRYFLPSSCFRGSHAGDPEASSRRAPWLRRRRFKTSKKTVPLDDLAAGWVRAGGGGRQMESAEGEGMKIQPPTKIPPAALGDAQGQSFFRGLLKASVLLRWKSPEEDGENLAKMNETPEGGGAGTDVVHPVAASLHRRTRQQQEQQLRLPFFDLGHETSTPPSSLGTACSSAHSGGGGNSPPSSSAATSEICRSTMPRGEGRAASLWLLAVVLLLLLLFFNRTSAVFCTCACLYCLPRLRAASSETTDGARSCAAGWWFVIILVKLTMWSINLCIRIDCLGQFQPIWTSLIKFGLWNRLLWVSQSASISGSHYSSQLIKFPFYIFYNKY